MASGTTLAVVLHPVRARLQGGTGTYYQAMAAQGITLAKGIRLLCITSSLVLDKPAMRSER